MLKLHKAAFILYNVHVCAYCTDWTPISQWNAYTEFYVIYFSSAITAEQTRDKFWLF